MQLPNITDGRIDIDETLTLLNAETQHQVDILKNDYGWTIEQPEE